MARKILATQDHAGNQIIDFRVENLASAPTAGKAGRLLYNTTSNLVGFDNGSSWRYLAPTDSPAFTGNPTAPTQSPGNNTTRLATTAFVTAAVTAGAVPDNGITNAKLEDMAQNRIKGRVSSGTGDPEDLTAAQVRTMINVADGATANDSDAELRDRSTHTGTQDWTSITSTPTKLDGYGITDAFPFLDTLTNSDNLDDQRTSGWHNWASASQPTSSGTALPNMTGVMQVFEDSSNTACIQIVYRIGGAGTQGNTYIRSYSASTWQDWEQMDVRTIADITGLQTALDGKAASSHTHTASQVTDFNTAVDTRVAAYWDSIASTDSSIDTIRELMDLVLSNQSGLNNLIGRYNADIGDGSSTSIAVTHSLGSLDVSVEVYEKSSGATVYCDVVRTNTNVVTLGISPAPASNALRVVIKK